MPVKNGKFRLVETVNKPAVAGPTRTTLPITECIQGLNLYLGGTITIAAVNGTGLAPEGTLALIRSITIEATSSSRREVGKIKYADFAAMYNLQNFLRKTVGPFVTLANANVQANTPVSADVQLDFEMPHSSDPRQTLLNTQELSTLTMIVDWGHDTDVVDLGVGTIVTFPTMAMKVSAREITDAEAKAHKYGINKFSYIEYATGGAANTRLLIDVKRGYLLRGFMIKQFTRAAGCYYHTPVNTIINNIALEVNREVKVRFDDWNLLRGQNSYDYQFRQAIPAGYAFVDLMDDGRYDKLIDTRQYRDVNVVLDVAAVANGVIRIYPVEIIPAIL